MGALSKRESSAALVPASELEARARELLEASSAQATRKAYLSDWRSFKRWARARDYCANPAEPETVARYLTELNLREKSKATISRALTAISFAHTGKADPTTAALVRELWKGIKRTDHRPQKQARPVQLGELREMARALQGDPSARALRDRALLLVGWQGAFRSSELVALNWSDTEESSEGVLVFIRSSKTDQEGRGEILGLPFASDPLLCAPRALQELQALENSSSTEAIFRAAGWGGARGRELSSSRASPRAVTRALQRAAKAAGLSVPYSSHSLRRGFASTAAAADIVDREIMRHGRWRSRTTLDRYVDRGAIWNRNPLKALLQ